MAVELVYYERRICVHFFYVTKLLLHDDSKNSLVKMSEAWLNIRIFTQQETVENVTVFL